MADYSFDIVSEVDLQEVDNALTQAKKEMAQRYDFKGSKASIEFNRGEKKITIIAESDLQLRSIRDIISGRMVKRAVPLKALDYKEPENAFSGNLRQIVDISSGIPKDRAKELVKIIKNLKTKVQAQVHDDKLKVFSAKKDNLQVVIQHLKDIDFPIALQFVNYR